MSTDYYFVCDACKERIPAFSRKVHGIACDPQTMLTGTKFLAFHMLNCDEKGVRIEPEQGMGESYKWIHDDYDFGTILHYLNDLPAIYYKHCKKDE